MLIFTKIADLQELLRTHREQKRVIGFVPTMGALHAGHLSLIKRSQDECDTTVCSIFVNPTQFNDPADLARYPRTPLPDRKMLENAGCEVLFMPGIAEMYPAPSGTPPSLGDIEKVLEGKHRPGHFAGVAQVVQRFFEIVQPGRAYFGSKDYQQVLVISEMVKRRGFDTEIVPCPIVRETDGLAMSSRNALLSPEERKAAGGIYQILKNARDIAISKGVNEAQDFVVQQVSTEPLMKLEYYEIADARTLEPISDHPNKNAISLIAVYVGKIRLIDNLPI